MFKNLIIILGFFITTPMFYQHAFAEIQSIEMQVDGMTCPFCVYGIEKNLKALQEVTDASSNLKTGIVDIELEGNGKLDIEKLNKAVRESGFTPGRIKIKGSGKLTMYKLGGKEYHALRVTGTNQVFLLTLAPDHEKEEFLSGEKLKEIEKASESGSKEIIITGYIHLHSVGVPPALSVKSFEVN